MLVTKMLVSVEGVIVSSTVSIAFLKQRATSLILNIFIATNLILL
jgi:hypothetical protein